MGAPFTGTWDAVANAPYYAGAGFESIWLWISIIMCVAACVWAHIHETKVNKAE